MTSTSLPTAPTAPAPVALTYETRVTLDIGRCFREAGLVFRRNFWALLAAGFLFHVLSVFTLYVFTGALCGGLCVMSLAALSRPDRKYDLGLLLAGSGRLLWFAGSFLLDYVAGSVRLS